MVEHHTHYKEIHGYDKTEWITKSEHTKLHNTLRHEGLCNIPANRLKKISNLASQRTTKGKKWNVKSSLKYNKINVKPIIFYDAMMPNIRHREQIQYNLKTGTVSILCSFQPTNKKEILWVDLN